MNTKLERNNSRTILLITVFYLLLSLIRLYIVSSKGQAYIVTMIPDDAFYGIELGKKRNEYSFWTFDGINKTNGFHFLVPHLFLLIFRLLPNLSLQGVFLIFGFISSVVMTVSLWCLMNLVCRSWFGREGRLPATIASSIPFFGSIGMTLPCLMMESSFVLFSITLSLLLVLFGDGSKKILATFLSFLGAFGVMARTDFLVISTSVVLTSLLFYGMKHKITRKSLLLLFGSFLCFVYLLLHSYFETGSFVQGSAQIKFYYSSVAGHSFKTPILLFLDGLIPDILMPDKLGSEINSKLLNSSLLNLYSITIIILAILVVLFVRQPHKTIFTQNYKVTSEKPRSEHVALTTFAMLSTCLLFGVYSLNSQGMQIWYTANFLTQISIIWSVFVSFISLRKKYLGTTLASIMFLISTCDGAVSVNSPIWPHAAGMREAGLKIKDNPKTIFGSWNSGMIAYFSDQTVINLDGLVNNTVIPFIKDQNLSSYILLEKIQYLVDYEVMLVNPGYQFRGGFSNGLVNKCTTKVERLDEDKPAFQNSNLYLFAVDAKCLENSKTKR